MQDDIIENAVIDPHLDSYEKFFDPEWAKRVFELVETSPLKAAVDALLVSWRSSSGAHLLPWLMAQSLRNLAEGEYRGSVHFRAGYSQRVVKGIVEKLETRMHHNLKRDQRSVLKRIVANIEEEAFQDLKTAESQVKLDVGVYWEFLTHTTEFPFCLLGLQRINYSALFFAYEDFLANTIKTRESAYTSKKDQIKDAFARHFGTALSDYCWADPEVDLARLVRNALAHNGGRFGTDLEKHKARFVDETAPAAPILRGDLFIVVNGKIQITPSNTKHLFNVLKERVTKIVEQFS
jgi:hypothetical protein